MSEPDFATGRRRQLTLGVLGHVDHGKTALVRALTGIETDRLAEERERGLSIVPGYAWFETDDTCIDLIDAPGHQAFVRAMIAAASGIDAALLVVAANEGVMPQTREHVAIAELLGIRSGLVVLTKKDLVTDAALNLLRQEIQSYIDDTFLRDARILAVSAVNDSGLEDLRNSLMQLEPQRVMDAAIPFFMPVDRSFTKSGFGRVATGTVHAGSVSTGDELLLTPGSKPVSVRGIQVHGQSVEGAEQGDRAAVNLRGPDVELVSRGMFLGHPNAVLATRRLDVLIEPLPGLGDSIRNGATLRMLVGTAQMQVKLRILEHEVASDDRVLAQLRCDRELPARPGMRFILRKNSPAETVGGGSIIDAHAPRRRRFDKEGNGRLMALANADRRGALLHHVGDAGAAGLEKADLASRLGIGPGALEKLIADSDVVSVSPGRVVASGVVDDVAAEILKVLGTYHERHPQHTGIRYAELAVSLSGEPHETLVHTACERLRSAGRIAANGDRWSLREFDSTQGLSDAQLRLIAQIEAVFLKSGVVSPAVSEVIGSSALARESFRYLMDTGRIVRLQTRDRQSMLALHAKTIESVRDQISRRFPYPDEFAVKEVRDLLGTTRKHVVPLLEHLDAAGFTLRKGDMRQIRK